MIPLLLVFWLAISCLRTDQLVGQRDEVKTGPVGRFIPDWLDLGARTDDAVDSDQWHDLGPETQEIFDFFSEDEVLSDDIDLLQDSNPAETMDSTGDSIMDGDVDGGEICQPQCEDLECGPDMCGGICGWCPEGKICKLGDCKNCSPDCEYSECGPDGCGGLCGTCPAKFLCVDGNCTPPGCNGYELIFEERFDTCTQGGFQIFDEQPDDPVTWHALPINHYSPPCALYLGDPQTFTYFTGSTVTVKLRSPIVAIPYTSAWRLSFRLLLDAEPVPMPLYPYDYDVLFLAFVEEGTEVEELLWSSKEILNTTDGELIPMAIELSKLAGRTGRFLFTFDTFDSTDNDYLGVHLDDVLVESVCPYCIDAEDCEDGVPCTFNKCVMFGNESAIGSCFYEPIADCCIGQEEAFCDDLNPCTDDFCDDEVVTCVYTEIPGCDPDNP